MQQLIELSRGRLARFGKRARNAIRCVRRDLLRGLAVVFIWRKRERLQLSNQTSTLESLFLAREPVLAVLLQHQLDTAGAKQTAADVTDIITDEHTNTLSASTLLRAALSRFRHAHNTFVAEIVDACPAAVLKTNEAGLMASRDLAATGQFDLAVHTLQRSGFNPDTPDLPFWAQDAFKRDRVLQHGFAMPPAKHSRCADTKRVMYCLAQSRPHLNSGYAIRSHEIVKSLTRRGVPVHVALRAGFPNDRWDFAGAPMSRAQVEVDGVRYHFAPSRRMGQSNSDLVSYQQRARDHWIAEALRSGAGLIHAASNFSCGLSAAEAATCLNIPFVYEMRGLWHMTRLAKEPDFGESAEYRLQDRLEIDCAARADKVLVITRALADYVIERGVDPEKVSVLPNAVDIDSFRATTPDADLQNKLGVANAVVIGYAGSIVEYEGLDLLLIAYSKLAPELRQVARLIIVGDGTALPELKKLAKELQIQHCVQFTGRVPHEDINRYYDLFDIVPLPRRGHRVCEIISPLKPFEAMAMKKALVVSDVPALAETIIEGETGMIHKRDCADSLSAVLAQLIDKPALRDKLGHRARDWVTQNRTWDSVCGKIVDCYQELGWHHATPTRRTNAVDIALDVASIN